MKLFLQCLLPDKVPDPANSKWAKECVLQPVGRRIQMKTGKLCRGITHLIRLIV